MWMRVAWPRRRKGVSSTCCWWAEVEVEVDMLDGEDVDWEVGEVTEEWAPGFDGVGR